MVTFCEERTPQKKRGRKDKSFSEKKKELLLLVVKKEQKQPRPRNSEKKEKKRLVAPQKKATPRLDSVFKNSVTHSFFSREAYNDLL